MLQYSDEERKNNVKLVYKGHCLDKKHFKPERNKKLKFS